jgi:hypothetical protein
MEIGAFFLLVVILIVLAAAGGGFFLLAARLRGKQLDPEGNKLKSTEPADEPRPEHREVETEQNARFVGHR